MSNIDIIRAWKDDEYRNSLSEEERSQLPENPAGIIELSDEEMENVAGSTFWGCGGSFWGCGGVSNNCGNGNNNSAGMNACNASFQGSCHSFAGVSCG
ncbi:MAG: hypothetical protein Kow0049_26190 [Stanieria sp.]